MQFKMLSGDVNWQTYGGKFVSKRLNNGEFEYWLVLDVVNMWEATGDESSEQYYVSLQAVSPEQVSPDDMNRVIESCGYGDDSDAELQPLAKVSLLADYGIYAVLWQESGNNLRKLLRLAHKQASLSSMLFGFYMDRPQNRLGQSGWNTISGQSVKEFFSL